MQHLFGIIWVNVVGEHVGELESLLPLSVTVQYLCSAIQKIPFLSTNIRLKDKGHSRTGHKDPEREWWYSSTLTLTLGPRWGWVVNTTTHFNRRVDGPQVRSGRLLKISPPIGIRFPDRPARSELLYWLSYSGPRIAYYTDRKLLEQLPSIIGIFISTENVQNPKLITFKDITQ